MVDVEAMKGVFEKGIYTSKIGFVVLLVILAFINGYTGYISSHPKLFAYNSVMLPFMTSLATLFMAWNRNSGDVLSKVFIVFLFLFFIQVFSELSGFYAYTGHEDVKPGELKNLSSTPLVMSGFVSFCISVFFLVLALNINQPYPAGAKVPFFLETIVFVMLTTFGEFSVLYNHGVVSSGGVSATILSNVLFFTATQIILQKGGFYERVFTPVKLNMY
jgi:hypothetical protein